MKKIKNVSNQESKRVRSNGKATPAREVVSATDFEPISRTDDEPVPNDPKPEPTPEVAPAVEVTPERQESTDNDEAATLLGEYSEAAPEKQRKRRTRKPKQVEPPPAAKIVIPGALFVTVCDQVATGAVGVLDAWLSPTPIDTRLLSLRPEQITQLAPLAEAALAEMKLEENPVAAFFGSLGAIYLTNYMQLRALIAREAKDDARR